MSRELWLLTAKFKRSLRRAPVRPGLSSIIDDLVKGRRRDRELSIRLGLQTREFEATSSAPVEPEIVDRLRALGGEVAIRRVSTPPF
jgi:hypothetical protein